MYLFVYEADLKRKKKTENSESKRNGFSFVVRICESCGAFRPIIGEFMSYNPICIVALLCWRHRRTEEKYETTNGLRAQHKNIGDIHGPIVLPFFASSTQSTHDSIFFLHLTNAFSAQYTGKCWCEPDVSIVVNQPNYLLIHIWSKQAHAAIESGFHRQGWRDKIVRFLYN